MKNEYYYYIVSLPHHVYCLFGLIFIFVSVPFFFLNFLTYIPKFLCFSSKFQDGRKNKKKFIHTDTSFEIRP